MQSSRRTDTLTAAALLVALAVVVRMQTPILPILGRVEFAMIFSQLIPIIFGPLLGGASAGIADLIGWMIRGGGMFLWLIFVLEIAMGIGIALVWRGLKINNRFIKMFLIVLVFDVIYVTIRTWVLIDVGIIPSEAFLIDLSPRLITTLVFVIPKVYIMYLLLNVYEKHIKKEKF